MITIDKLRRHLKDLAGPELSDEQIRHVWPDGYEKRPSPIVAGPTNRIYINSQAVWVEGLGLYVGDKHGQRWCCPSRGEE